MQGPSLLAICAPQAALRRVRHHRSRGRLVNMISKTTLPYSHELTHNLLLSPGHVH